MTESGFEAWASGPVHPQVWLQYAKWKHPQWPGGSPVLVGDTLIDTTTQDVWVVLDVRLEQRGVAEAPTVRLGNPLAGPEEDDMILFGESPVGSEEPDVVVIPEGFKRGRRFAVLLDKFEAAPIGQAATYVETENDVE